MREWAIAWNWIAVTLVGVSSVGDVFQAVDDLANHSHTRQLSLVQFSGYTLQLPANTNLISFASEKDNLLDVRAGVRYNFLSLLASSNLGTNESAVRIKLMYSTASDDIDCLPGSVHEAPHVAPSFAPPTPLDGHTPAEVPIFINENKWAYPRFPYSGVFVACYYSGVLWRHVAGKFTVKGVGTNVANYWCVASSSIGCRLLVSGSGIKSSWTLSVLPLSVMCGSATSFSEAFDRVISLTTLLADGQIMHSLGNKRNDTEGTFRVCYCPGYNEDENNNNNMCTGEADFQQHVGLVYATRVNTPQWIYPKLNFDLIVRCGGADAGGCPLSKDLRIKVTTQDLNNDRPVFDSLAGCRTAQQVQNYILPSNCLTASNCNFEPTIMSTTSPQWNGLRIAGEIENHAQRPLTFDVCFCTGSCSDPNQWFKADSISNHKIEVLPNPIIVNTPSSFALSGPYGGWSLTGHINTREMKLLFDPEGTVSSEDCFQDPQNARAIAGHVCYSVTDCQSPSSSVAGQNAGHIFDNLKVRFAGMYAVCYCDIECNQPTYWTFVEWHLVAGPSSNHVWSFSRSIMFDLNVVGLGLQTSNRLRVTSEDSVCGEESATPSSTVTVPDSPPVQKADLSGIGVFSLTYAYDGMLVSFKEEHGLIVSDYIAFQNVSSLTCAHCADLVNSRPHKVVRVPSALSVVIPIVYIEQAWPDLRTTSVSWIQSNKVVFEKLSGSAPSTFRVCWANNNPSSVLDFVGDVGTLTIFEPPVFPARVHLTSLQSNVIAPAIISFQCRIDPKYASALGDMQLKIHFPETGRFAPAVPVQVNSAVSRADALQSVCGSIFKELWSSEEDGFPMPKGCFYDDAIKEYNFLFSAKNGLRGGGTYQIVLDTQAAIAPGQLPAYSQGILHLWSMDDVDSNPYGVIEFGPANFDKEPQEGASGSYPQFDATSGATIEYPDTVQPLSYTSSWSVPLKLRSRAGSPINEGDLLRVFLWPLTQWHIQPYCVTSCQGMQQEVNSEVTTLSCESPICVPESVVTLGIGARRNSLRLTFSSMVPITDSVMHTIMLAQMTLPAGGFFPTRFGAELQDSDGMHPSYTVTSGSLIYLLPSTVGSVVSYLDDGNINPFRGDQGNTLYIRLVLGASIWGIAEDSAGFTISLPPGYVCVQAEPAPTTLNVLKSSNPQGRGSIGLNLALDGYWLYSGETCVYFLRPNGVVYAGSAIFVKVHVNNPVFPLQKDSPSNTWTVRLRSKVAPMAGVSGILQEGAISPFSEIGEHFQNNVAVLGKITEATLTPAMFGSGQSRNFLNVYFRTEQGTSDIAPNLELILPAGFGFLPQCIVEPLQLYQYASMSSHRTGITIPTKRLYIMSCQASSIGGAVSLNRALMKLSRNVKLEPMGMYGFRIQVFNSKEFQPEQRDGFCLTTMSASLNPIDATYYTIRFLASDGEGAGTSFGVYHLPMYAGSFVVSLGNMLPFSDTGLQSSIMIFPLRVPFDSRIAVSWRVIAPHGYEWDFVTEQFQYRTSDILGVTADLPIATIPAPPALPPKNILDFEDNFAGAWDRTAIYGFGARIRTPDATPRSTVNSFFIEFGYDSSLANTRYAGASYEAPQVRALVNSAVDYEITNLAGQQNRILIRFETITSLVVGGGLQFETPTGFIFEERCILLDNPMRQSPSLDLNTAAQAVCGSEVPYTTGKPLITIAVVDGEIRPGLYEFMIDAVNPRVQAEPSSMIWTIFAYTNIGNVITSDLATTVQGFAIETPMGSGELVDSVSFPLTERDDHPNQKSFVVLGFQLQARPPETRTHVLTVKAPLGFSFAPLCEVFAGDHVFGPNVAYQFGYQRFEPSAAIEGCHGVRNTAKITVKDGLTNLKRYVFRLEVFNPASTPDHNRWTISFAGESTMPFSGYRLWAFTEINIAASHGARSSSVEETKNTVTIRFRPTNTITNLGFMAVTAPFGFRIATECMVKVLRLNPLFQPIATVPYTACRGAPQPTNAAEVHLTHTDAQILALEPHEMHLEVVNPLLIPIDPGTWRLQSYREKAAAYVNLLDEGEAPSFALRDVFHRLQVAYPFIEALDEALLLTFQIILPHAAELGDTLAIDGPPGYDFAMAPSATQHALDFRECRAYRGTSPPGLPSPKCLQSAIRFAFQVVGIELEPFVLLTPLIEFQVETVYPTRTLALSANVFHAEHNRGESLLSSKTVPGQMVTPRLQGLQISRQDTLRAVGSKSRVQVAFSPSQAASAISITSRGIIELDLQAKYRFSEVSIQGTVQLQSISDLVVAQLSNFSVTVETILQEGLEYVLFLQDLINPEKPGRALWTCITYTKPAEATGNDWIQAANQLDSSEDFVGPRTISRILLDPGLTVLTNPFFDSDGTELVVSFHVYPSGVSAGQYLILSAPYGYSFIDRTFKPGDGFPLVSGSVYVRGVRAGDVQDELSGRAYVIQIRTAIDVDQLIRFSCRVNTPRTPEDIALFETDYASTWLLMAATDALGHEPSATNDELFPGFVLKASFGATLVKPEPNGVTPRKHVMTTVTMNPQTTLRSIGVGGSITVRITAPLGFDFDAGCLAITPNPVFVECTGLGRFAVLPVRDARLSSGVSTVVLGLTNAGITPAYNKWVLESFVDVPVSQVQTTEISPRQQSVIEGYAIRELIQATIGANTQRADVTKVFVWFLSTNFIDVGGAIELHAPTTYSLRCSPRIDYISLPAGTCKLEGGASAEDPLSYHHYLVLTLTLPGQVINPNSAYEFAVPAINPLLPVGRNFWGLVLKNPRKEVVDATMTLPGYDLTDYQFTVDALLAGSTRASIVNYVQLTITFQRQLPAGTIHHITIVAPSTSKVMCPQFSDLSGGGSTKAMLRLDANYGGAFGDHSCQYQNTMTLHVDRTQPILAGSYNLQIGVLNPRYRAVRDYWAVQLLGPTSVPAPSSNASINSTMQLVAMQSNTSSSSSDNSNPGSDWRTATPVLQIEVPGYGISTAWAGETLAAVPTVDVSCAWNTNSKVAMLPCCFFVMIRCVFCVVQLHKGHLM